MASIARRLCYLAAASATVALTACAGDATGDDTSPDDYEVESASKTADDARAANATNAFLQRYWDHGSHYFSDTKDYWIDAQAFDAVLDAVQRTEGKSYRGWIARIYDGQNARGWRRDFFDDENWMAMALVRAYDLTHEKRYLDRADELFRDIEHAWDRGSGGICWDRGCTQKATAANAGPVILAARLYERRADHGALAFAKKVYAHWWNHMVDHRTGAVTDDVRKNGEEKHYKWSYNEGLMIGAAVALHEATHDGSYLSDAHLVASYMLQHETVASPFGRVLDDGATCSGDCEAFKGIAYRYLLSLYWADPSHTEYRDVLNASARAIWADARHPSTQLFGQRWVGPASESVSFRSDASAVMALNLHAIMKASDKAAGR